MTSIQSISSTFPPIIASALQPAKATSEPPSVPSKIKEIDNPLRIKRAMDLLYTDTKQEYTYSRTIQVPKSSTSRETIPLKLEFNFNVDSILNRCIKALKDAGFPVKAKFFKGGAIHYVMDGYPATLRDFDVGLVIDPPKGDPIKQWQIINEIILRCLEDEVGLSLFKKPDNTIAYSCSKKKIAIDIPLTFTREGYPKISLFEHPGGLENFWWWGRKPEVRAEGEEYALFTIPAFPCPIDLEIVASHKNSSTCSLDALRLHYNEDENGIDITAWMTAVDEFDVHKACSLRRKRLFYCQPDRIPTIRDGLLRYCSHLVKGFLPTEIAFETAFCKAFFNDEASLKYFSESLPKYLGHHTSSKEDRIRYLLNLDAIIGRCTEVDNEKKLPLRAIIGQLLLNALEIDKTTQKPEELIYEMQLMRDYLYLSLSKNRFFHTSGTTEYCCLDDPKGREYGSFVIEAPKSDSLNHYLGKSLNQLESLKKICKLFPHTEKCVESFFCQMLKPKIEKSEVKEAAPSSFKDFDSFLKFHALNPKLSQKACAKQLQNLFSFKSESLKALSETQIADLRNILIIILDGKDRSLTTSLFIDVFKNKIFRLDKAISIAEELIKSLLISNSSKEFKDALIITKQLILHADIPFNTLKPLILLLLNTPENPKPIVELLAELRFDKSNIKEQLELWNATLKKIESKTEFHSQIIIFWRLWNDFSHNPIEVETFLKETMNEFTKRTIHMLIDSKQDDSLYWAYHITLIAENPLVVPLNKVLKGLIRQWMAESGPRMSFYYLKCEHLLLRKEVEKNFTCIFSSFIRGAFQSPKNREQIIVAIKRGIEKLINTPMPIEEARIVSKQLDDLSKQKNFPVELNASINALRKFVTHTREEKFSPSGLKQLKTIFYGKQDYASFEECLDLIRILTQSTTLNLQPVYTDAIDLFEKALNLLEQGRANKIIELLPKLQEILFKNKNWSEPSEKQRFGKCIIALTKLVNSEKTKATSYILTIKEPIDSLPSKNLIPLKNANEELLLENHVGDAKIWCTLLCCYITFKDWNNVIRCSEEALKFVTSPFDRYYVYGNQGNAYSELGDTGNMVRCCSEILKIRSEPVTISALALAYIHDTNWLLALRYLTLLQSLMKENFAKQAGLTKAMNWALLGSKSKFEVLILKIEMEIEKDPKALPLSLYFMLGRLYKLAKKYDKAISIFTIMFLGRDPDHHSALMELGSIHVEKNELTEALKYYEKAQVAAITDAQYSNVSMALAEIYEKQKDWNLSFRHYTKAYLNYHKNFDEIGKIKMRIAILQFIFNWKNSTLTNPLTSAEIQSANKSFEHFIKVLGHKEPKKVKESFNNAYALFKRASSELSAPHSLDVITELKDELTKAYFQLSDALGSQKQWELALACLEQQKEFLSKDSDKSVNRIQIELITKTMHGEKVALLIDIRDEKDQRD